VLRLGLSPPAVAALVAVVFVATIATRTSRWYLASAGTAVLILRAILYGITDANALHDTSWTRVVENVLGAAIALFYGLLIPSFLARRSHAPTPIGQIARTDSPSQPTDITHDGATRGRTPRVD
jgi:hypothetical protein